MVRTDSAILLAAIGTGECRKGRESDVTRRKKNFRKCGRNAGSSSDG